MNSTNQIPSEAALRQELESLQEEAAQLNERRIRIQSELERAREERDKLKGELEAEFGTSDVGQLRELLSARARSNQEAVRVYADGVSAMRAEIARVNNEMTKSA